MRLSRPDEVPRALTARQHGGDVTLDKVHGRVTATLQLPVAR
jgi:hypothetical protein